MLLHLVTAALAAPPVPGRIPVAPTDPVRGIELRTDAGALPLLDATAHVTVLGGVADVSLEHRFAAPRGAACRTTWAFSPPEGAELLSVEVEAPGRRLRSAWTGREAALATTGGGRRSDRVDGDATAVELGSLCGPARVTTRTRLRQPVARNGRWSELALPLAGVGPDDALFVVVDVADGLPVADAWSPTHSVAVDGQQLTVSGPPPDDALVITWSHAGEDVRAAAVADDAHLAVAVEPPARPVRPPAREVVVVVDRTERGVDAAAALVRSVVDGLGDRDLLGVYVSDRADGLAPDLVDPTTAARVEDWLRARTTEAPWGDAGLRAALVPSPWTGFSRSTLYVSDAWTGAGPLDAGASRLSVLALDPTVPLGPLVDAVAASGGVVVDDEGDLPRAPVVVDLRVETGDWEIRGLPRVTDVPDEGRRLIVEVVQPGSTPIRLSGRLGDRPWTAEVPVTTIRTGALATRAAELAVTDATRRGEPARAYDLATRHGLPGPNRALMLLDAEGDLPPQILHVPPEPPARRDLVQERLERLYERAWDPSLAAEIEALSER